MKFNQDRLEKIAGMFHQCLFESDEANIAREYLSAPKPFGRGIDFDSLKKYEVGFCPPDILYPGKHKMNEEGHLWYMRGRIVFVVRDLYGRILCFNGRKIDSMSVPLWESLEKQFDDQTASELIKQWDARKWVNESFSKGHHIFRLHEVHRDILETGSAVIVEGCLDSVVMHMADLKNTVSLLGTKMSLSQIALLKRFTNHLVLCFDADQGGESIRSHLENIFGNSGDDVGNYEMSVSSIILPAGLDPEDALSSEDDGEMFRWSVRNASEIKIDKQIIDLSNDKHRAVIRMTMED